MELRSFSKPSEYRDHVFPFLRRNEAQNCLGLGIVDTLISRPETYPKAYLWTLAEAGHIVGAAWMTPPHPVGLTDMPEQALDLLVDEASQLFDRPKSVVGPKTQSDYFAKRWTARHGLSIATTMEQRIYQLTDVTMPFSVPGELRVVEHGDQRLLEEWGIAFIRDCGLSDSTETASDYASRAIKTRSRYIWTVGGEPVSMAGASGSTPSGIRINWVYTPDKLRGRGYASAVVAALSRKMLSEGRKFCFLYTDLANPTSNSIYQKIGYRPVCDSAHHSFGE
jgi:predicted GNAT family acetyltransferase